MTAPPAGQCPATTAPAQVPQLVVSASRLKKIAGEKGDPGCERRYAAEYLFDMRQSGSAATELGTAVHYTAEVFQETGEIPHPESEAGSIFRSAMHLVNVTGALQVEYEHRGFLPDGTSYVARMDGASDPDKITPELRLCVVQDLKTTSNKKYALNEDRASPSWLGRDRQAMLYAWVVLCNVHWYAKSLGEKQIGPLQWRVWDPAKLAGGTGLRECRLRWLYMLTRGLPKAWDVNAFVTSAQAEAFMQEDILPWVAKMKALHTWRAANPTASLNKIDRNITACGGSGRWCGAGERNACAFSARGTPIEQLIQLGTTRTTTHMADQGPQARLAALKLRMAGNNASTPAPAAAPPPAAPEAPKGAAAPESPAATPSAPVTSTSESVPPTSESGDVAPAVAETPATTISAESAPESKGGRGRPKGSRNRAKPPTDAGTGVNPPEVKDAIKTVAEKMTAPVDGAAEPLPLAPELSGYKLEMLLAEIVRRVMGVAK